MLTAGRCMYGINGICQLFFGSMRHRSKLVCSHSKSACLSLYRFRFCDQFLTDMAGAIVLAAYVGAIYIGSLVGPCFTLWRLYSYGITDTLGLMCLALLAALALVPLKWGVGRMTDAFVRLTCVEGGKYFPITIHIEDQASLDPQQPYVLGLEPHSALPIAIPLVFATASPLLPTSLRGRVHGMASSVCFAIPFVRQLWWWLGLRPVSRQLMDRLLDQGKSVVLNPGGVQECCEMEPSGSETVFLRKRHGFVRMALKHGAPLIPVFAFGQGESIKWYRPHLFGLTRTIARRVGAVPMAMWGRWGTSMPLQHPMDVVIGTPIKVPKLPNPSHEEVELYLGQFITAMQDMFEKYKDRFPGSVRKTLRVL